MTALAEACKRAPFATGTEGDMWQEKWCAHCVHDHEMHNDGWGPGCALWMDVLLGAPSDDYPWPESWLPEPDDGSFSLPSRLVCLRFEACAEDGCTGDPGAEARAERVAEVQVYWRERATS